MIQWGLLAAATAFATGLCVPQDAAFTAGCLTSAEKQDDTGRMCLFFFCHVFVFFCHESTRSVPSRIKTVARRNVRHFVHGSLKNTKQQPRFFSETWIQVLTDQASRQMQAARVI